MFITTLHKYFTTLWERMGMITVKAEYDNINTVVVVFFIPADVN